MPLNVPPLPAALAKKAKEELFEDPSRNEENVQILREWVQKQPHISARLDDQILLSFIRASKHRIEGAKKRFDLFCTVRTALPQLYRNRRVNDPRNWEILKAGVYIMAPKPLGEGGPKIMIIRPGFTDANKFTLYDMIRPETYYHELRLMEDDAAVIGGLIQIFDVSGMALSHLLQIDLIFLKKLAILAGEGSFLRQKGLHFINMTPAYAKVLNLFKTLVSEKQQNRIYVHSDMESLFKHVPQNMLPKEYGGENGSVEETITMHEELFAKYRDYFAKDNHFATDEALRPPDSKFNPEALFGADGTFRKLEVD